jgi:hypothetical protein
VYPFVGPLLMPAADCQASTEMARSPADGLTDGEAGVAVEPFAVPPEPSAGAVTPLNSAAASAAAEEALIVTVIVAEAFAPTVPTQMSASPKWFERTFRDQVTPVSVTEETVLLAAPATARTITFPFVGAELRVSVPLVALKLVFPCCTG